MDEATGSAHAQVEERMIERGMRRGGRGVFSTVQQTHRTQAKEKCVCDTVRDNKKLPVKKLRLVTFRF